MRLLLLNQFYPPDTAPTGQVLHDLARTLVARGHAVDVVCSRRSYDGGEAYPAIEEREGVRVHRVPALGFGRGRTLGRLADYASYLVSAALVATRRLPRPDVVLALTTPPFVGLLARALAGLRGAAHVHWVMDVYPDVLAAYGMARSDGFAFRGLARLARRQHRGARLVLALGPFMLERLRAYAADSRTECLPLWGEDGPPPPDEWKLVRRERGWGDADRVLLYSGNLGRGHRAAEFLAAAHRLGKAGPIWAFAGGGARRPEVEAFASAHPEARVSCLPYVSRERLRASLASADVHLASLSRPWQGLIVPSKVQAAFSVERPVIFVGPRENEIARWIEESGGGWLVDEDDVDGLLRAVEAASDAAERQRRGARALSFARERFDRGRNCEKIAGWLEECVR